MGVFHLVRCAGLLLLLAGVGAQKKLLEKVLKKTTTLKPRLLQTSDGKDSYPRHFASCRIFRLVILPCSVLICPFQASYLDCLIRSGWKVDQNNRSHYLHSHVSFIYRVYRLDFSPLFAANLPLARVNHPIPIIKSDATHVRFILHLHHRNLFNNEEKITSDIPQISTHTR